MVPANPDSWLFSRGEDLALFWLPLTLVFSFALTGRALGWNVNVALIHLILVRIPFDIGHIWATTFPLLSRRSESGISKRALFLGPLLILLFCVALYSCSSSVFYLAVAYAAIFHIARQQYGWVMTTRRLAGEPARWRWLDTVMIWNVMIYPVLWWQSSGSALEKSYAYYGSLHLDLPASLLTFLHAAHWLVNLFYISFCLLERRQGRPINWAKISLLLSTWCWFYGSLVVYQNYLVFFTILPLTHAAPYLVHCFRTSRRRMDPGKFPSQFLFLTNPLAYAAFFLVIAVTQYLVSRRIVSTIQEPLKGYFLMLILMPLLWHYYFDALIWKKRAFVRQDQ